MNIAENATLWNHPYYEQIKTLVAELNQQNLIKNGAGFCYAMSDLIHHRLSQMGINSTVIECEMTMVCSDPPAFVTVGHKEGVNLTSIDANTPGKIYTHVIVLVEHADTPLIIDASISHLLPDPFTWVCALADNGNPLSDITRGNWHLTYRQKTGDQFPAIHQKSIVDRMILDQKVNKLFEQLRIARWLTGGLVAITALLLAYNFYITFEISDRQQVNSGRITLLEEQHKDVIERLRSYRDHLLELQNNMIKDTKR